MALSPNSSSGPANNVRVKVGGDFQIVPASTVLPTVAGSFTSAGAVDTCASCLSQLDVNNIGDGSPVYQGKDFNNSDLNFRSINGRNGVSVTSDERNIYIEGGGTSDTAPSSPEISTGTDWSTNKPSIPITNYVQITVVPKNLNRYNIEIQNQDTHVLQVVRDDGTGQNQSVIFLEASGALNSQGGGWSSTTFGGRCTIYGFSSSHLFSVFED